MTLKPELKNFLRALPGAAWLASQLRGLLKANSDNSVGPDGIRTMGHRLYVGGFWEEIGKLQLHFLVRKGLQPHHYLVDIACGSLRAGVHIIPYLESGHYLGLEKEEALVRAGIESELGTKLRDEKHPEFVISSNFEFEKFHHRPDFALAQSLFTHLTPPLIDRCFKNLRGFIAKDGVFYATFNQASSEVVNPSKPHDHEVFWYTQQQMLEFGAKNGWRGEYIGDWQHPRNQMMMKYTPLP